MRILMKSGTYFPALNGEAIFTTSLAEGLAKLGHDVLVVFPSLSGQPHQSVANGVRLLALRSVVTNLIRPGTPIPLYLHREIREIIDDFQPEIVHIQDHFLPARQITLEAQKRGLKLIGTNHFMPENFAPYIPGSSLFHSFYNRVLWLWVLEVYNRFAAVTTQSKKAAEIILTQRLRPPVFPISCGVDLGRFHPDPTTDRLACRTRYGIDPNRIVFLYVGRVDREKRVDVLVRAMQRLHRDDIQLVVAGHGSASGELQSLANSLGLGNRVRFTGFVANEDLPVLLNSVDIFTMPSEAELLSIASLEAMASGRPLLLANAVALPELVSQGENGYLFKPGDVDDAAHYMNLLADQRERWSGMGAVSLEKAQCHSLDTTVRRYEMLYEALFSDAALEGVQEKLNNLCA